MSNRTDFKRIAHELMNDATPLTEERIATELHDAFVAGSEVRGEDERGPIPIRLECPSCGELHIDEGKFATKPHHTHACQHCGHVWRPAIVDTVGVRFLPGFKNATQAPREGDKP